MKNTFLAVVICVLPAALCAQPAKLLETEIKEPAQPQAAPAPAAQKAAAVKAPAPAAAPKKAAAKPAQPAKPAPVKEAAVLEPVKEPVQGAGFSVGKKHLVTGGDTLWDLSGKYYSDPYKWGKIYNANLSTVENPDRIYPKEELVIPDLTEEVKPELKKEAAGADTVKDAELSSADIPQQEEAAAEEDAPAPAPAAAPARPRIKTPPPAAGEFTKAVDPNALSESMPDHQKEWSGGASVVPAWWKEDGVVTAKEKGSGNEMEDSLTMGGEVITVSMSRAGVVTAGDYLAVYLKGSDIMNKAGKTAGREIQYAGMAEVVSVDGTSVKAVLIDAVTAVAKGYIVKKK